MGKKQNYGRDSAALLAATGVFLLGFVAIMFVLVLAVDDPLWPLVGSFSAFLFFVFVVVRWVTKADSAAVGLSLWSKAKKQPPNPSEAQGDYSPSRVRTSFETSGENPPPSAEDVKEAREVSPNTWVPSSVPKRS